MAPSFRKIINDRIAELHESDPTINRHWLLQACDSDPSRSQLYGYLDGSNDMRSANIEKIIGVLGGWDGVKWGKFRQPKRKTPPVPPKMPL